MVEGRGGNRQVAPSSEKKFTALLSRVNGDRWLLKNLKNCVSILDFDIRGF